MGDKLALAALHDLGCPLLLTQHLGGQRKWRDAVAPARCLL